jgi:hypothetical protein
VKLCLWKKKYCQNCSKHWHVSAHYKCTFALRGSGTCFWVARVQQPFGFHHISTELRDVKHNGVVTALRHTAAEQNLVLTMPFCYWRVELQTNSYWHRSVSRVCLKRRDNYSNYRGDTVLPSKLCFGRATAQVVSRRYFTAEDRIHIRVSSRGIWVG